MHPYYRIFVGNPAYTFFFLLTRCLYLTAATVGEHLLCYQATRQGEGANG